MCILTLFNKSDVLSFNAIADETNIPVNDLKRNLFSLSCGKYRILLKDTKTKRVDTTDKFAFNKNFKCQLVKIKILNVAADPSVAPGIRARIDEDRRLQIEAAVVRVMKAR